MFKPIFIELLFLASVLISGCGNKKGDSGEIKIEFAKKATSSLLGTTEGYVLGSNLETLKIKPMAAAISKELTSNKYMIWGAKNCAGQNHKFEQDDKEFDYYVYEEECIASADDSFLDMLDPVALNANLNSQIWPVPPGTYHWVTIAFCSTSKVEKHDNISYRAPFMEENIEYNQCDPFTGYNADGVTIEEGGAITIKLTYDVDKLVESLTHTSDMEKQTLGEHNWGCTWVNDSTTGGQIQYCPKTGQGALVPSISN